jgi:predicted DNA-binding transcriptional regulator YafY
MTDDPVEHQEEGALDAFVSQGFGIFGGEATGVARLRFSSHAATWVAEENWHPDQQGEWRGDGYYLNLPYADARELTRDILAWGAEVEVLGPPALREDVRLRLANALGQYD